MDQLRTRFGSEIRKRLSQQTARNELDVRQFRAEPNVNEMLHHLLNDVEPLMLRAGVESDVAKKQALMRCFSFLTSQLYDIYSQLV
jgi:hypothetical protein